MRLIDADRALEIVREQGVAHPNAHYLTDYATLILREAPTIDAVPVVRCEKCVLHGNCTTEDAFVFAGIDNPFCCSGKWKEGADEMRGARNDNV